jgi:hypothetical protein
MNVRAVEPRLSIPNPIISSGVSQRLAGQKGDRASAFFPPVLGRVSVAPVVPDQSRISLSATGRISLDELCRSVWTTATTAGRVEPSEPAGSLATGGDDRTRSSSFQFAQREPSSFGAETVRRSEVGCKLPDLRNGWRQSSPTPASDLDGLARGGGRA